MLVHIYVTFVKIHLKLLQTNTLGNSKEKIILTDVSVSGAVSAPCHAFYAHCDGQWCELQ